ncbi:MAG TPA: OsmC family peroxiredoxin [Actinomycetota bacterium]|nr:OsmC family peroxiredoxin [Actinomycetota bacterium]
MPMAVRVAEVSWKGNLTEGEGDLSLESSKILQGSPITWASRAEAPDGRTSPEELLAGAHASCYAMALSNTLTKGGTPPDSLEVRAECTLDRRDEAVAVTAMHIMVRGSVSGLDDAGFQEVAKKAEEGCPISNALRGNVDITLDAHLA